VKQRISLSAFSVLIALLFCVPMFAHHGAWTFDMQHETTVMGGTVTRFQFVNSHVEISWESKDDKGIPQKWTAQTTNPNTLYRYGWNKEILKPGTELQMVSGNRCKNGENCMRLRKIVLATGKDLPVPD
jgi:Family of unknown function (DUF6152)